MQYLVTTKHSKVKAIVDSIAPIPLPGLEIKELRTVEDYIMCLDVQDRMKIMNNMFDESCNQYGYNDPCKTIVYNNYSTSMWEALASLFVFDKSKEGQMYWYVLTEDPFKESSFWD